MFILQGRVVTQIGCDGMFNNYVFFFFAEYASEKVSKSVNIQERRRLKLEANYF